MLLLIRKRATKKELDNVAKHFKGYVKVVVDLEKEILTAGADRHFDEEKELLARGSKQENLWGGGVDVESKEIDYNSIINLRPSQDNPSRDILSKEIREKIDKIVKRFLF